MKGSHSEAFNEVGLDVGTPVLRVAGTTLFGPVLRQAPAASLPDTSGTACSWSLRPNREADLHGSAARRAGTPASRPLRPGGSPAPAPEPHQALTGRGRTAPTGAPRWWTS
ncbi:mycothiol-dependent nitroreductase Rv2466c family protein [Streptomyces sp. SS]|uniref:mycothiol-dependent nitroreductase Rv2466c family protein n=1 Tax=Streptomyces sp. SS TaxID=260742 RepID=UPI003FCF1F71